MTEIEILEQQTQVLFDRLSGWENYSLKVIGERIKNIGSLSYADAQALNNIALASQDVDKITKELAKVTGLNIKDFNSIYSDMLSTLHVNNKSLYDYRNVKHIPFSENETLQNIARTYSYNSAMSVINLSKTKALGFITENNTFKFLERELQETISKSVMAVSSGSVGFNEAMRTTVETLGGSGVRVNYGGGITRRLDTVVRSTINYGVKQATQEYSNYIGNELGCDGFEVDYHDNARPSHRFMQGKQYSNSGTKEINGKLYEDGTQALISLGDYGCLHYKTPIILGISEPRYSDKELSKFKAQDETQTTINGVTKDGYGWKQTMRQLETEIRKEQDISAIAKASGDNVLSLESRKKSLDLRNKYNEITEKAGIQTRLDRTYSVSGKTPTSENIIKLPRPKEIVTYKELKFNSQSSIINETMQKLKAKNVEYKEVQPFKTEMTESQIIDRLGGGDFTKGSCSSLAFAYSGNKSNLDVLDFRGGISQSIFSSNATINEISGLPNVKGTVLKEFNDFTAANKLLKTVESGKEYYLGAGQHAAIIRKTQSGFEYLELQSATSNGFKPLTTDVLKRRFGCKKSHTVAGTKMTTSSQLIECESLGESYEFKELLGYINTSKTSQMKGVKGSVK